VEVETNELGKKGKRKNRQVAGSLAVLDFNQKLIYKAKVFRPFGSYKTSSHTRRLNGITDRSLPDCEQLDIIIENLHKIFENRVIIGISLISDLEALDLPVADYEIFDLQWYFY
jgi:hypothetical protein